MEPEEAGKYWREKGSTKKMAEAALIVIAILIVMATGAQYETLHSPYSFY